MQRPAIIVHGGAGRRPPGSEAEAAAAGCARAAAIGWQALAAGGSAVEAVIAAVACMEDDAVFNAGLGSCLTADGTVEMDASLMDGERRRGAGVALLTTVRNPILLAAAVWRDGRHVLLAGPGAEAFARQRGLATVSPEELITARQRERWSAHVGNPSRATVQRGGGTVGAVAVDRGGRLAAATSTGGMLGKLPGRIGDSAILGAGTYADSAAGAASATGHGESIILSGLARAAVDRLRGGRAPAAAAPEIIRAFAEQARGAAAGVILIDRFGRCAWAHNAEFMSHDVRPAT